MAKYTKEQWQKLKEDYQNTVPRPSVNSLAKKLKVNLSSLQFQMKKNNWFDDNEIEKIGSPTDKKIGKKSVMTVMEPGHFENDSVIIDFALTIKQIRDLILKKSKELIQNTSIDECKTVADKTNLARMHAITLDNIKQCESETASANEEKTAEKLIREVKFGNFK